MRIPYEGDIVQGVFKNIDDALEYVAKNQTDDYFMLVTEEWEVL